MSPKELEEEKRLTLWSRFLSAKSEAEFEALAKEDAMIRDAKNILAHLSAEPSAQEKGAATRAGVENVSIRAWRG